MSNKKSATTGIFTLGESILGTNKHIGVKTTCKDRWRQVLNEGTRLQSKHILTLQPGISSNQLTEMHKAGITLVVPRKLQKDYPKDHPLTILGLEDFITNVKEVLV